MPIPLDEVNLRWRLKTRGIDPDSVDFYDEPYQEKPPVPPPVETPLAGGGSWSGAPAAAARAAGRSLVPTVVGGGVGLGTGMGLAALAAKLAPATRGASLLAAIPSIIGGLAAGGGAGYGADVAQRKIAPKLFEGEEEDKTQYPWASFAGRVAPQALFGITGPATLGALKGAAGKGLGAIAALAPAEKEAAISAAANVLGGAVSGQVMNKAATGEWQDPKQMALDALAGMAFVGPHGLSKMSPGVKTIRELNKEYSDSLTGLREYSQATREADRPKQQPIPRSPTREQPVPDISGLASEQNPAFTARLQAAQEALRQSMEGRSAEEMNRPSIFEAKMPKQTPPMPPQPLAGARMARETEPMRPSFEIAPPKDVPPAGVDMTQTSEVTDAFGNQLQSPPVNVGVTHTQQGTIVGYPRQPVESPLSKLFSLGSKEGVESLVGRPTPETPLKSMVPEGAMPPNDPALSMVGVAPLAGGAPVESLIGGSRSFDVPRGTATETYTTGKIPKPKPSREAETALPVVGEDVGKTGVETPLPPEKPPTNIRGETTTADAQHVLPRPPKYSNLPVGVSEETLKAYKPVGHPGDITGEVVGAEEGVTPAKPSKYRTFKSEEGVYYRRKGDKNVEMTHPDEPGKVYVVRPSEVKDMQKKGFVPIEAGKLVGPVGDILGGEKAPPPVTAGEEPIKTPGDVNVEKPVAESMPLTPDEELPPGVMTEKQYQTESARNIRERLEEYGVTPFLEEKTAAELGFQGKLKLLDAQDPTKPGKAYFATDADPTTPGHEMAELFFERFKNSTTPADQRAVKKLLESNLGDKRERLADTVSLALLEKTKTKLYGGARKRFTEWLGELKDYAKMRLGSDDEATLVNVLASRIMGEPIYGTRPEMGRAEYLTLPKTSAAKGASAEEQTGEFFQRAVSQEVSDTISEQLNNAEAPKTSWLVNKMVGLFGAGTTQELMRHPNKWYRVVGRALDSSLRDIGMIRGHYAEPLREAYKGLSNKVLDEELFPLLRREFFDKKRVDPDTIPAHIKKAYTATRDMLVRIQDDLVRKQGRLIRDVNPETGKVTYREPMVDPGYVPNMIDSKVWHILHNKASSPEFNKLRRDYIQHFLKQKGPKFTVDDAGKAFNDIASGSLLDKAGSTKFGPAREMEGIGIPDSWADKSLRRVMERYISRMARDASFYKHLEESPVVRRALGLDISDPYWKAFSEAHPESPLANVTQWKNSRGVVEEIPVIAGSEAVQSATKYLRQDYSDIDANVDAAIGLAQSGVLGLDTGMINLIAQPFVQMAHAPDLAVWGKAMIRVLTDMPRGYKRALETSLIKPGVVYADEGLRISGRFTQNVDFLRKWMGRLGLRQSLENLSRAQSQIVGEVFMERALKEAQKGNVRMIEWLKDYGSGTYYNEFKRTGTLSDLSMKRAATAFAEISQGTYDPRTVPAWAMTGSIAPYFKIARWSIGQTNMFAKHVIEPALVRGNFKPALQAAVGTVLAGFFIELYKEYRGQTSSIPGFREIENSEYGLMGNKADVSRRLAHIADMVGITGLLGMAAKAATDALTGHVPREISNPGISVMGNFASNTMAAFKAATDGKADIVDVVGAFCWEVLNKNVQSLRVAAEMKAKYLTPEGPKSYDEKLARSRMAKWKDVADQKIPLAPVGGAKDYSAVEGEKFKNAPTMKEAFEQAKELRGKYRAEAKQQKDPSLVARKATSLQGMQYDTMPDPETNPVGFRNFRNWYVKTWGEEAFKWHYQNWRKNKNLQQQKRDLVQGMMK